MKTRKREETSFLLHESRRQYGTPIYGPMVSTVGKEISSLVMQLFGEGGEERQHRSGAMA